MPRLPVVTIFVGALLMTAGSVVSAAPLPRYGLFVFSSLCTSAESGDAEGNRLMLVRDGDGDRGFWEWSEGPLEGPVAVTRLHIGQGRISFDADIGSQDTVDSDGKIGREKPAIEHLEGTITAQAIRVDVGSHQETWRRVTNFAARTGSCR